MMPRTGRPPKPTALKVLEGTARSDRLKTEPQPEVRAPRCPSWLPQAAKSEWKRLAKTLVALGLLSDLDRGVFCAYCVAWAKWRKAEELLEKHNLLVKTPNGYPVQSPLVSIAKQEREAMLKAGTELGLSPAARTRIDVRKVTERDADNPWRRFA